MDDARLRDLTSLFSSRRIAVVGDFFLDKYLDFDPSLSEISLETDLEARQVVRIRHSPGAAGNIVGNLVSLGAGEVVCIGFTGDDGEGYDLRKDLISLGCSDSFMSRLPERHTPTYLKPCDASVGGISGERERYDTKNRDRLPDEAENFIVKSVTQTVPNVDAVIIADQADEEDCGVITSTVRDALCEIAADFPKVIFWVDSRRRIGRFRNTFLKPNAGEALAAVGPSASGDVFEAGAILFERAKRPVFLTRSERGIVIFDESGATEVPGIAVEGPIDPTGAGDSATAGSVLGLSSGATNAEAALLANMTASITVQQLGTTGRATVEDLKALMKY